MPANIEGAVFKRLLKTLYNLINRMYCIPERMLQNTLLCLTTQDIFTNFSCLADYLIFQK